MKKISRLGFVVSIALLNTAMADSPTASTASMKTAAPMTPAVASKASKAIKPATLSCEEFLEYDEVSRPQIVYWSEGLTHKGKPDDAEFDVERTNTLVPVLVEDCTKEPKTSYWKKFKAEVKKVF
jgi:hypothetical protein